MSVFWPFKKKCANPWIRPWSHPSPSHVIELNCKLVTYLICHLTWEKGLGRCDSVKDSEVEGGPGSPWGADVTPRGLARGGRSEGREGASRCL